MRRRLKLLGSRVALLRSPKLALLLLAQVLPRLQLKVLFRRLHPFKSHRGPRLRWLLSLPKWPRTSLLPWGSQPLLRA